jgi:hypothetical protein
MMISNVEILKQNLTAIESLVAIALEGSPAALSAATKQLLETEARS